MRVCMVPPLDWHATWHMAAAFVEAIYWVFISPGHSGHLKLSSPYSYLERAQWIPLFILYSSIKSIVKESV